MPSTSTRMTEINKATDYTPLCKPHSPVHCSHTQSDTQSFIGHSTKGPSLETFTCKHTRNRTEVREAIMLTPCTPYKQPLWPIHLGHTLNVGLCRHLEQVQ